MALATAPRSGGNVFPESVHPGPYLPVARDIMGLRTVMVNLYVIGVPGTAEWVLVDTGLPCFAGRIRRFVERRFGPGARPRCIILTHGHFDHVGNVRTLADDWDVPVYAHPLELPFLQGEWDYLPPDPTVGGGMLAATSFLYPHSSIDLGGRVRALPGDGSIPELGGWQWIHTPGHTPGHVALFREADRVLLAGDAFITTRQESLLSVITQEECLHGPPAYFTTDWNSAEQSVQKLAALRPNVAATGHGVPMCGEPLDQALQELARDFQRFAVPARGRYVHTRHGEGPLGITPKGVPASRWPVHAVVGGLVLGVLAAGVLAGRRHRS